MSTLRVLVAHNLYRSATPSGENEVVREEVQLLRDRPGLEVETLLPSSDDIRRTDPASLVDATLGSIWAPRGVHRFTAALQRFRPHVVHLHNPFPLLSPEVLRVAARHGVPVVQSVHNYRYSCAKGVHFRDGAECTLCLGRRWQSPAVVHACYRGSRPQSLAMITGRAVHQSSWQSVAKFLAVSRYQAELLVAGGLPAARVQVKPNSVPDPGRIPEPGPDLLFLGRLEADKGLRELVTAWRILQEERPGRLRIAGAGELRPWLEEARADGARIEILGSLDRSQVDDAFRGVGLLVAPSLCAEAFGRTAVEALAAGRPALVSDRGALPELATSSAVLVREPTVEGLVDGVRAASALDPDRVGQDARDAYLRRFTPSAVCDLLVAHYEDVCGSA